MRFVCHGGGKAYWANNHLFVEPHGPFNVEGALQFAKDIEAVVEEKSCENWYRLDVFYHADTLVPIEAKRFLSTNFAHSKAHGCILVCIVGANTVMRELIKNACESVDLKVFVFQNLDETLKYVSTLTPP